MSLPEFDLRLPATLEDALGILSAEKPAPAVMGGGTDLLLQMRSGGLHPATVVSLSRVEEIQGIREEGGALVIGGGVTIAALESDSRLVKWAPALLDAARSMATVQIRNRATLAGNIVTAAACADLPPVLAALDASVTLASARGRRTMALSDFITGARATALAPGELLIEVRVPAPPRGSGSAYEKFGYRRGAQIAVASAAAFVRMEGPKVAELRLVLGAVAPIPLVVKGAAALVGERPEGEALERACSAAAVECQPISDIRGSEEYRRSVVAVMARRAIEKAVERARETEIVNFKL